MAIYYINPGGNDAADGLSHETGWQTVAKITSGSFSPGDSILLERGGTYGHYVPPSSGSSGNPITIGAYGSGVNPICYGAIFASGWSDEGGNIWSFTHVSLNEDPKMVRFDGTLRERGKSGYFTITAASGTEEWVEATGLPTFTYTGVQIVTRNRRFIFRVSGDVSKSSNRLTYGSDMTDLGLYNCIVGYGFFLQNHSSYLTTDGDWMYDSATDTLYMYFADDDPDEHEVLVATQNHVVDCAGKNYINIDGLALIGSISHGVNRDNNDYVNINNCEVAFCGDDGICNPDFASTYCLVTNSEIHDCHSSGIYANYSCHHMEATNNWIYNCGLHAGASSEKYM